MPAERPSQHFEQELAHPGLVLNLTAAPWFLGDGQSQMILGRDVIHPGRIAPEGGRRPIGCSIPLADRPLTSVIECNFVGRVPVRWSGLYQAANAPVTYSASATHGILTMLPPQKWRAEMVGAFMGFSPVYVDPGTVDQGRYLWELRQVTSVGTAVFPDDELRFAPVLSFTPRAGITKLWIDYQITVNRNGLLVSNGRKFWFLQGGVYYQVMDLGSDAYLGERWQGSMIANDRVMLTSAGRPPRLFFFREPLPNAATADAASYAGLGTPVKPPSKEPDYTDPPVAGNNPSWLMTAIAAGAGALSAGTYRVMVRTVNLTDGSQSPMVRAFSSVDNALDTVTVAATGAIRIYSTAYSSLRSPCPYDPKWTHLEVWRTRADGAEFYLEGRIPIVASANEWRVDGGVAGNDGTNALLSLSATHYDYTCRISDANLIRRPSLLVNDLLAGYRPPVCREACSLQGVTVCAGKAAAGADPLVSQYAYMFFCHVLAGTTYTHATRDLAFAGGGTVFAGYTDFTVGDEFVITASATGVTGAFPIESKVNDSTIRLLAPGPGVNLADVQGYIRRPYLAASEQIASDEEVWYSRTDQYAPESFLRRTLTVSRSGDEFMGLRAVGRYAAMIMADGVHLLYLTTDLTGQVVLERHTVASNGAGTVWPDSILTWDRNVVWATARGPVIMRVSDDPDEAGMRGQIAPLDKDGSMREWFEDAYRLGESIDAGVDTHNGTLRFRRHASDDSYQVLQFSYRTGLWTLLDDDSGLLYARSKYAGAGAVDDPLLYSVNRDGSVFEVNYYGLTHPCDGKTLQGTISPGQYVLGGGGTQITEAGAFSAAMLGEVVRFRSSNSAVDGVARLITAATANSITFAAVAGLANGDEFIIGATRFRWRSAPLVGRHPYSTKTLSGLTVRARPGQRATEGNWGVPAGTPLSLRCWRNHDLSAPMDEQEREIAVFDEDEPARTSADRVSSLQGQGSALQIELECLEARTSFVLESVRAQAREESSELVDASTAS